MLWTWQAGDCSKQEPYNGDFDAAMKGIKAKALVLPSKTDLYFRKCFSHCQDFKADISQLPKILRSKSSTCGMGLESAFRSHRYMAIGRAGCHQYKVKMMPNGLTTSCESTSGE